VIPGADLVIGLFVQLIIWIVVRFARFVFGIVRTMLVDHPGMTAVLLITAVRRGWIDLGTVPTIAPFVPLIIGVLFILGLIRFLSEHSPTGMLHRVNLERRRHERSYRRVTDDGRWVRDRFRRGEPDVADLPPPPAPIPMGPVALDVQEVHEQPGIVAEAFTGGDSLVTSNNGRKA
jgi:hypothetical protein